MRNKNIFWFLTSEIKLERATGEAAEGMEEGF